MKRQVLWIAVAMLVAVGCGKKDEETSEETPKPNEGTPGKTCDKGQVLQDGECIAMVTEEKVQAVKKQVSQLEKVEQQLEKIDLLVAPLELVNAIRELDAWKTAAKTSDKFEQVDEMVVKLKAGADELKAFRDQLKASKAKLADLGNTLEGIYESSGAAKTVEEARAEVSTQVRAAIEPLQARVNSAMEAIEPAFEELEKLDDIISGVCAMGSLYGGGPDFEKLCDTGKEAFEKAIEFLEEHKDAPRTLLSDVVTDLEKQLDTLVDENARKVLDEAEAVTKEALGEDEPAPEE